MGHEVSVVLLVVDVSDAVCVSPECGLENGVVAVVLALHGVGHVAVPPQLLSVVPAQAVRNGLQAPLQIVHHISTSRKSII